jgi:hypothetical protein
MARKRRAPRAPHPRRNALRRGKQRGTRRQIVRRAVAMSQATCR